MKSTSEIKVVSMKNIHDFYFKKKPLHATGKLILFAAVSKDDRWNTKEDTGTVHEECIVCAVLCDI